MARWQWVLADTDGNPQTALTAAQGRSLTFDLKQPAQASFDIDGRHETAALIDELATDLIVYRNTDKLFRGRIGQTTDSIDANQHRMSVQAADYAAILGRRIWWNAQQAYTATEQATIAWALINHTQGQTGGNLGITDGTTATGATTDRTIEPGRTILSELQALADGGDADGTTPGFEWWIDADLMFHIGYPQRGSNKANSVVLEHGGLLSAVSRTVNPQSFANAVRASGADALTEETREAADLASRSEGRWDAQVGDTTIATQNELSGRADFLLDDMQTIRPSWQVTWRLDGWDGPDHVWLGDTITLVVQSGRVDAQVQVRCEQVSISIDDTGTEQVQMRFGPPLPTVADRLRAADARVSELERT